MNKRIRKKHAKRNWVRMQQEMRDPAYWQRHRPFTLSEWCQKQKKADASNPATSQG